MTRGNSTKHLRIGILGTRGIPASYGGFETFAEQLSLRLSKRGHQLTVYGRRPLGKPATGYDQYQGVSLIITPTIMCKYLETPLHALTSFLDLFRRKFDIILLCNAANSPLSWLVKLRRLPLVINLDGVERKRKKWNLFGRLWYRLGEISSVWFADRLVGDAEVIARYYSDTYSCQPEVIAYGAEAVRRAPGDVLSQFNLKTDYYLLYVSRLEPENNALGVIQAYNRLKTDLPLVIVGDAPYARKYITDLKNSADSRVIFTGFQFGEAYQELQSNCRIYIQATEVGGTHPALVEAMAYGNCIIANNTPEHLEVLGSAGAYYDFNDFDRLQAKLEELLADDPQIESYRQQALQRAREKYDWEAVCDQYESLFFELCAD